MKSKKNVNSSDSIKDSEEFQKEDDSKETEDSGFEDISDINFAVKDKKKILKHSEPKLEALIEEEPIKPPSKNLKKISPSLELNSVQENVEHQPSSVKDLVQFNDSSIIPYDSDNTTSMQYAASFSRSVQESYNSSVKNESNEPYPKMINSQTSSGSNNLPSSLVSKNFNSAWQSSGPVSETPNLNPNNYNILDEIRKKKKKF